MKPRKHGVTEYHQKRIRLTLPLVIFCAFLFLWPSQSSKAQSRQRNEFPAPYRVIIDTLYNSVSWRAPGKVLLTGDFENDVFPPSGWTTSSGGKGWIKSGTGPFMTWLVPENGTQYALANDDSASVQNDGSLDLLITPIIDLTQVDSCRLIFSSYFNSAYGQSATVKYRNDPFGPWTPIGTPSAVFDWTIDTIDLSPYSGTGGLSDFQLAFHADDHGHHASGWAIDDVEVFGKVLSLVPEDYLLFWDGEIFDSTSGDFCALPFTYYGEIHEFGICARYSTGNSDTILTGYESRNLPPPEGLEIQYIYNNNIVLDWLYPYYPPYCIPMELQFDFETETSGIQGGCESDGQYIYISYQYAPKFDKYDLEGNYIETFTVTGIPGILDMAWDPGNERMFGGHGGNIIYVMDFATRTLVDQITAPCNVRGLAYDPWDEVFYANNLSSNITLFDYEGDTLFSFPVGETGNLYGLAVDWEGDHYLWGFSRDGTGALLVEYDIWEKQATGVTIDASFLAENEGQACGLYINYDIVENCATLGGNLWNDVAFGFALHEELSWGWDPPGVDHYLLYNQDTLIYSGEYSSYYYNQPGYEENSYKFEVSALYNLTDFGYPGQFRESAKCGPVIINGPPPQPDQELDFLENWESESLYTHQWDTTGPAWWIHPNLGNPAPAVVLRGLVNPDDYNGTLTSDWFIVDLEDSCEVMLIFDLKIVDATPTGLQSMDLEVLDIASYTWRVLRSYHNDSVMPGFITDSILLSHYISANTARFRWNIFGTDAADVGWWVIDNIRVEYTCLPPYDLQAELVPGQDSVLISWQHPYSAKQDCLHYDNSIKFIDTGFGTGPENWYDVAAHWELDQVRQYSEYLITGISFIPTMEEASYILKIWTGDQAQDLVFRKIADNIIPGEWYYYAVTPPVPVDILTDLWIGYSCSSRSGFPFAMDAGPALDGYGNMVRINSEWSTMLSINPTLDYNFNLQARLERPAKNVEAFQLFRSIDGLPFQHVATTDSSSIILPLENVTEEQCFRSRIICYNRPNFIKVSGFSNPYCVIPVNTEEANPCQDSETIIIYPNPTSGFLYIESPEPVETIMITDLMGQWKAIDGFEPGQLLLLNLDHLEPGIYLIKIHSQSMTGVRKIVIM